MVYNKRRNPVSLFTANTITSISITLVLVLFGLTILVFLTNKSITNIFKDDFTITIEVPSSTSQEKIAKMKQQLESNDYLSDIKYISKEEVKKEIINELGSDPEELLGFDPTVSFFDVHVKGEYVTKEGLDEVKESLKELNLIQPTFKLSEDEIKDINNKLSIVGYVLLTLTCLLVVISFVLIKSIIQLNIYSKRFLIRTMQLVGARNSFIRAPFLSRMFFMGFFSAIFAFIIIEIILLYAESIFPELNDIFTTYYQLATLGIIILFGVLISLIATASTVNSYLRMDLNRLYRH